MALLLLVVDDRFIFSSKAFSSFSLSSGNLLAPESSPINALADELDIRWLWLSIVDGLVLRFLNFIYHLSRRSFFVSTKVPAAIR